MRLTASRRLYGLGAIILAALVACSRSEFGARPFLISLVIAGVAYLFAVREFFLTQVYPRRVIFVCLALAVLWRMPFLMTPPGADDDIHRYLWDGRVQRLGYDPYKLIPADPALAGLHTPETRELNNPEVASPYPPGAQLFFRGVTAIHESIFAFKIAFVLCDFAIIVLLMDVLRRSGQGEHWVLAYAWHPLLATNVAGSPHIDIVGALLVLLSVTALARRWRAVAAVTFALAIAVKFLPIVLTPLYWRRFRLRDGLLALITLGLLYLPFLEHGRIPFDSLRAYVQRFRFNDPVFAMLERVASPQIVAGFALLVGFSAAVWLRRKHQEPACPAGQWAWPMAASLLCAPVVYPWYLLWMLPFLRSASALPIMVWTISILPTYFVWHLRSLGQEWHVPGWMLVLEYGAIAVTAAIVWLCRGTKADAPTSSEAYVLGADVDQGPAK